MDETEQASRRRSRRRAKTRNADSAAANGPAPAPPAPRKKRFSSARTLSGVGASRYALTSSLTSTIVDVVDERSM